jgi:hypothetical protein
MRIEIRLYNRQTLRTWIDYACLFEIIEQTFGNAWSEVCFTDMSDEEKKIATGTTTDGLADILAPFFIATIDDAGVVTNRPDLDVRLTNEGRNLPSGRSVWKDGYRIAEGR